MLEPRRQPRSPTACRAVVALALLVGCSASAGTPMDTGTAQDAGPADAPGMEAARPDTGPRPDDASSDAMGCTSGLYCGRACCAVGEECHEGACVPTCASGVRCGTDGLTCCAPGRVCMESACASPGDLCNDSYDCAAGSFCEPTLGACLPQPVSVCEVHPPAATFTPVVEWRWTGTSPTGVTQVAATPAVADIDLDGDPEVVVVAYGSAGVQIVVLSGVDGTEEWVSPETDYLNGPPVAVGNLDADPELEIVAISRTAGVVALEHDGTRKWNSRSGALVGVTDRFSPWMPAPVLVNVDADPQAEVMVGGVVLDHDGTMLADRGLIGCSATWRFCASAAADLDGNGVADIVGGRAAYAADGRALWSAASVPDGFPAVADMNGDGVPDVVTVGTGRVHVLNGADGSILFGPVIIPGGGDGGPPTIADFDGDGNPEFAAAGEGRYTVYDLDCTPTGSSLDCGSWRMDGILWSVPVQDTSSSTTGSSVFDFEGDGQAEIIYNDECHMYVLDGRTGATLLSIPNSSRTGMEYPLVVDVDRDNNSEIVVVSTDDQVARDRCTSRQNGVTVYGDSADRWVPTRPIWNQHSYHVTNVNFNGTIPLLEINNWELSGLNNYRQNVQGEGVFNAPDLAVAAVSANLGSCPAQFRIQAAIQNRGSLGIALGVPVAFYVGPAGSETLLGVSTTIGALLPGAIETVIWNFTPPVTEFGPWRFLVIVDDDGTGIGAHPECREDNNSASIDDATCDILI